MVAVAPILRLGSGKDRHASGRAADWKFARPKGANNEPTGGTVA